MLKKFKNLLTNFFIYVFYKHSIISTIILAIGIILVGFLLGCAEILYEDFLEFVFENYTTPAVAILVALGIFMVVKTIKFILKMEKSKREELKKKVFKELILLGSCILIVVIITLICININN